MSHNLFYNSEFPGNRATKPVAPRAGGRATPCQSRRQRERARPRGRTPRATAPAACPVLAGRRLPPCPGRPRSWARGTQREALLYAISANAEHGLPRTNADKRRAVSLLLGDPEWSQWNDREIARRCCVSHGFVDKLRKAASGYRSQMQIRKVRRGDQVYELAVPQADPVKENLKPPVEPAVTPPAGVTPRTDRLGISIPEERSRVFAGAADFAEARQLFARLKEVLDRIAQQPGGAVYRQQLDRKGEGSKVIFESALLRAAFNELQAAEPYCAYCPLCELAVPGSSSPVCHLCQGRGWTTAAAFAACPEGHRQAVLRLKDRATQ